MTDVATPMPPAPEPTAPEPVDQSVQRSPRTHVDSAPLPTDSMVTVPLSETDGRTPEDDHPACTSPTSPVQPHIVVGDRRTSSSRADSIEIRQAFGRRQSQTSADATTTPTSPTISVRDTDAPESPKIDTRERRTSNGSGKSEEVDWAELEKKEEQEPEGEEEVRAHSRYLMPVVC